MTSQITNNEPEIIEFLLNVEIIYGFYLDTITAYKRLYTFVQQTQQSSSTKSNIPIEELDQRRFIYGRGHPDNKSFQHVSTQGEFKLRMQKGGSNEKLAANFGIVLLYQYWEYYRRKIAKRLSLEENKINSDIMGDLRYLRNSILKNKSIGIPEIIKCKRLNWFQKGDEISISEEQVKEIMNIIKTELLAVS